MTFSYFKQRYPDADKVRPLSGVVNTDRKDLSCAQISSRHVYQKIIFFIFTCMLPLVANSSVIEEVIPEKRIGVAMRMIGHQVLMCLGDDESRVLPIEKTDEQYELDSYRISFEYEFEFDPGDIVAIIDRVMMETKIASHYFVEVEQCETKEMVYSFEVANVWNPFLIPCEGRIVPKDCYSLIVTILDNTNFTTNLQPVASDGSSITSSETNKANLFKSAMLVVSLLILIGFMGYFIKKKDFRLPAGQATDTDSNLILIGASKFDKRNMALSFEDKRVELSYKEAELLSVLHTSANVPVEREVLLQRVWGDDGDYVGRTLDVFISKLRKKLDADASVKIVNIRGVGYKLLMDVPR